MYIYRIHCGVDACDMDNYGCEQVCERDPLACACEDGFESIGKMCRGKLDCCRNY